MPGQRYFAARASVSPSVRPLARSPATELVSPIIITVPNLLSTTLDLREAAQHTRILTRSLAGWLAVALSLSLDSTLRGKSRCDIALSLACERIYEPLFGSEKLIVALLALWAFAAVRLRLSVWLSFLARDAAACCVLPARRRVRSSLSGFGLLAFSTPFRT
jgi:hypothetical protein